MKQFDITGMSCAACSNRVEKAVKGVEGVLDCSVNLLTNSLSVKGNVSDDEIISAVVNAGYGAKIKGENKPIKDTPTDRVLVRLVSSVVLLLILMYFSMGHMLSLPLPKFFEHNFMAQGIMQLILSGVIMVINQRFFINGFKSAIKGAPNMDTLVALGSGTAFLYSTFLLFDLTVSGVKHGFYFESAGMIVTLITVGKMLESYSKGKTTNAIKSLMDLSPKTATLLIDGKEKTVPIEKVKIGDVFILRAGDSVPVDGVVLEGESSLDESALTGESVPSDKEKGSRVYGATVNLTGFLKCEATRVGEDTTLSQIVKMVENASATKAPVSKIADRVCAVFVPSVIAIAIITTVVWLLLGQSIGYALARGISVLVISCPCALGLATPVAIMVGSGVGAKRGILFKSAESLEIAGKVNTVVLDKTGTLTTGKMTALDVVPYNIEEDEFLSLAVSLEIKSEHPLGKAVVRKGEGIVPLESENFEVKSGSGLCADILGKRVCGGNLKFIEEFCEIPDKIKEEVDRLSESGKTPLLFCRESEFIGIIAVADTVKEDSKSAVEALKKMGIKPVMLTGDNQKTADAVGRLVGIDTVIAGVLPNEKENYITSLKQNGKVMMVGDGVNDAVALTSADVGAAIGAGADIATQSADVVLVNSKLSDVVTAIKLSRKTLKNIRENLFWAFLYNALGIPLAAGVFVSALGWELNPMVGALAMSLSSFSVVTNALRLNFFKEKREKKMEKIIKIEGMMCPHCEAHVKKALEAVAGVEKAEADHKNKKAVVTLVKDVPDAVLKKAVEDAGYKVL